MSDKHYVNEVGTEILIDCGSDITGATVHTLEVRKPDGTIVSWAATISGTNHLSYISLEGDFNMVGLYLLQAKINIASWAGRGETAEFEIFEDYS
jgi:hypothetical protein